MSAIGRLRGLEDRLLEVERLAELYGWETRRDRLPDGGTAIVAERTDRHPDVDAGISFGFTVAFSTNPNTGRATTLYLDGRPGSAIVVIVDDGSANYWTGPLAALETALEDPQGWTGTYAPAPAEEATR